MREREEERNKQKKERKEGIGKNGQVDGVAITLEAGEKKTKELEHRIGRIEMHSPSFDHF